MTTKKYTFISDPGHGWLEVPILDVINLNVFDKISIYSYINTGINAGMVYLEEDCDYSVFWDAAKKAGWKIEVTEVYEENTAIRNYPRITKSA